MTGEQRRQWILQQLQTAQKPISATALAKQSGVSRQIVVGDIALMRAAGEHIEATPRGYRIAQQSTGIKLMVACCHTGLEQLKQEQAEIEKATSKIRETLKTLHVPSTSFSSTSSKSRSQTAGSRSMTHARYF